MIKAVLDMRRRVKFGAPAIGILIVFLPLASI